MLDRNEPPRDNWREQPYRSPSLPSVATPPGYDQGAAQMVPHSLLGVAAFVIGLLVAVGEVAMVVLAGWMTISMGDAASEDSPLMVAVGLGICGGITLAVLGLTVGAISLVLPARRREFGLLGVLLNGMVVAGVCGLMALGLLAGG